MRGAGFLRDRRRGADFDLGRRVRHRLDIPEAEITALIREHFDLTPYGIQGNAATWIRPIYRPTAAYGHFGREDQDFSWERTDKADALSGAVAA